MTPKIDVTTFYVNKFQPLNAVKVVNGGPLHHASRCYASHPPQLKHYANSNKPAKIPIRTS